MTPGVGVNERWVSSLPCGREAIAEMVLERLQQPELACDHSVVGDVVHELALLVRDVVVLRTCSSKQIGQSAGVTFVGAELLGVEPRRVWCR